MAIAATLIALLVSVQPASAATAYEHTGEVIDFPMAIGDGAEDSRPQQMAVDPANGHLFVADHGLDQVHVLEPDGDTVAHLASFAGSDVIASPIGIAIDPDSGDIYVGAAGNDLEQGLVRFTQDTGADPGDPSRYEHDDSFELSDTADMGSLGSTTPDSSQIAPKPGGIALDPDSDTLVVLDVGEDRVHRFDTSGDPVAGFPALIPTQPDEAYFDGPSGDFFSDARAIAVDEAGNFTVADAPEGELRVTTFEPDGTTLAAHSDLPGDISNGVATTAKPATGETLVSSSPGDVNAELFQYEDGARTASLELPGAEGKVQGSVAAGESPDGRLYATATTSTLFPGLPGLPRGELELHVFSDLGEIPDPPEVTIDEVEDTEVTESTAELSGTVDPNEADETHWRFEYRRTDTEDSPDWTEMDLRGPESGDSPEPVSDQATGLEPATDYEVRLFADSGFGATAVSSPVELTTKPTEPVAETGEAWSVTADSSTLAATVDPRNAETEYFFEYGTDEDYDERTDAASASDGGAPRVVTAEVSGLDADATHHFRVVAHNVEHPEAELAAAGDDVSFTTRPAEESALPERGYELVSRSDANGIRAWPFRSSVSGDAYVYSTAIPSPGAENAGLGYFRMTRGSKGSWAADPHMPTAPVPREGLSGSGSPLFSAELRQATSTAPGSYHPLDANGVVDLYIRDTVTGELTWLSREPEQEGEQTDTATIRSNSFLSADASHALFTSNRNLLPSDQTASNDAQLYEWEDGTLRHVSVVPGTNSGFDDDADLGAGNNTRNAVSRDGNRIVFTTDDRLFIRINGEETRQVGGKDAAYTGADVETREVVYVQDDTLFLYGVELEESTEIAPPVSATGSQGVFYVSDDVDRIYFSSTAELTADAGGADRYLYLAERSGPGQAHEIELVSALHPDDIGLNTGRPQSHNNVDADPSGSLLAFTSKRQLVPGRQTGGFPQVYVYEAGQDRLSCASCPTDGTAPSGRGDIGAKAARTNQGGETGNWLLNGLGSSQMPAWRNVAENGSVFFQSDSQLVPGDGNQAFDTYEWRGGKIQLLSSGIGTANQYFSDASSDGGTVFFRSRTPLTDQGAVSGVTRIWAAREGGGWQEPEHVPGCQGDGCRGPAGDGGRSGFGASTPGSTLPTPQVAGRDDRGDRRAAARCIPLIQRGRALRRRALALRGIARRSSNVRQRRAVVRRFKVTTKRTRVVLGRAQQCRRAAR